MPAHTDNKLSLEELDKMTDTLIDRFDDWRSDVKVDDMPLNFNRAALATVLKEANRIAFKLLRKAVGIAYINENYSVQDEDSQTAIQIFNTGTELQELLNRV